MWNNDARVAREPRITAFYSHDRQGTARHGARRPGALNLLRNARDATAKGGEIRADSAGRGMGARFDVELPAYASAELPSDRVDAEPEPLARQLRILLVDNDRYSLELVARLLEHRGLRVTVADSVACALARAEQGFDVLVSDPALPDGTGQDLARQLASKGPLRAIAPSGYSGDEGCARAATQASGPTSSSQWTPATWLAPSRTSPPPEHIAFMNVLARELYKWGVPSSWRRRLLREKPTPSPDRGRAQVRRAARPLRIARSASSTGTSSTPSPQPPPPGGGGSASEASAGPTQPGSPG